MSLATRPLFSGYLHILNTKIPSTGVIVVTRHTRSAMTHAHEDLSGSSQPPAKKMKLEPTSATTVEICPPHVESSSLVIRGKSTLGEALPLFSLLTSTAPQSKIPNPRTQLNERDKPKAEGRKKHKSWMPRCFLERVNSPWKVGAHVSAAGGVENAVTNAITIGFVEAALDSYKEITHIL